MVIIKRPKVERWKDIAGFEGWYQVSNWGEVRRVKGDCGTWVGRVLKPALLSRYPKVTLCREGREFNRDIHVLVATAFCRNNAGEGAHAHHRNGDKLCAWSTNLQWLTPRKHLGEEMNPYAKPTRKQVGELKRRYRQGSVTMATLAKEYGVDSTNVSWIVHRRGWKHVKTPKA